MHRAVPRLTECQFFQGAAEGLREHEVDEYNLVGEEAAIRDEILPTRVFEADRVDECREEIGQAAEKLKERNTVRTLGKGPYFYHIRCRTPFVSIDFYPLSMLAGPTVG